MTKTFITHDDINDIAECLDDNRLNRQRSEVTAILKSLLKPADDDDHASVRMWRGNERFLVKYGVVMCTEWQARGNNDETMTKILQYQSVFHEDSAALPEWWGDEKLMNSHRSYLLRSMPSHYRTYWPDLVDDIAMIYPRTPDREPKSEKRRERERLIKKAWRAQAKAEAAVQAAKDAAIAAGLDPDTMEPIPDEELDLASIGTPDDDLLEL